MDAASCEQAPSAQGKAVDALAQVVASVTLSLRIQDGRPVASAQVLSRRPRLSLLHLLHAMSGVCYVCSFCLSANMAPILGIFDGRHRGIMQWHSLG